eukprot:scaffold24362_cov17-Prasinocladus_malaysianus.AAC.1
MSLCLASTKYHWQKLWLGRPVCNCVVALLAPTLDARLLRPAPSMSGGGHNLRVDGYAAFVSQACPCHFITSKGALACSYY